MTTLVTLTLISAVGRSVLAARGIPLPEETGRLASFGFDLVLASCIHFDRRARAFSVPYEFDAFMFFAWPFLMPWYLYRTRGKPGLLYAAATYGMAILPTFAAAMARIFSTG